MPGDTSENVQPLGDTSENVQTLGDTEEDVPALADAENVPVALDDTEPDPGDTEVDPFVLGDVDGNAAVTAADAAKILRYIVRLEPLTAEQLIAADANEDGKITAADAAAILRYIVKLDTLPPSAPTVPFVPPNPAVPPMPVSNALAGKTIVLDAGHGYNPSRGVYYGGSYDWSKQSQVAYPGGKLYIEANRVLDFALETKRYLEASGATVILTRDGKNMVGSYVRTSVLNKLALEHLLAQTANPTSGLIADIADLTGILNAIIGEYVPATDDNGTAAATYHYTPYPSASNKLPQREVHPRMGKIFDYERDVSDLIFISIHTNATATSPTASNGVVTYYMNNSFYTNNKYSKTYYANYRENDNARLANLLLKNVSTQTGLRNTGRNAVNDFFMIREVNVPAALVEVGYHSNWNDYNILAGESCPAQVAYGILLAVQEYFNA